MGVSRKRALARGQEALQRPRGAMEIILFHGKTGLTLKYEGKVIARTHASAVGKKLAPYVAEALGVPLPPRGQSAKATVSSGILFRVLSISSLDLRGEEAEMLLAYLLQEAAEMRGFQSAAIE